MPELEQEIYKKLHWHRCRQAELIDILRDNNGRPYAEDQLKTALVKLADFAIPQPDMRYREVSLIMIDSNNNDAQKELEIPDISNAPEACLMSVEGERLSNTHMEALKQALINLPADLALYIRLRFYNRPPKAPREIARLMGRTDREIYRIRQDAMSTLKSALERIDTDKNSWLSV
jgi:hypothetical protein